MAKIGLIDGFRNLEVGEEQLLLIKKSSYDEKYMKAKVTFADDQGRTCTETFSFKGKRKGELNEVALGIFSTLAKCALKRWENVEIDPESIEGLYVVADVFAQEVELDDGRVNRYIHVRNFKEADVDGAEAGDEEDDEDMDGYL